MEQGIHEHRSSRASRGGHQLVAPPDPAHAGGGREAEEDEPQDPPEDPVLHHTVDPVVVGVLHLVEVLGPDAVAGEDRLARVAVGGKRGHELPRADAEHRRAREQRGSAYPHTIADLDAGPADAEPRVRHLLHGNLLLRPDESFGDAVPRGDRDHQPREDPRRPVHREGALPPAAEQGSDTEGGEHRHRARVHRCRHGVNREEPEGDQPDREPDPSSHQREPDADHRSGQRRLGQGTHVAQDSREVFSLGEREVPEREAGPQDGEQDHAAHEPLPPDAPEVPPAHE